MSHQHPSVVRPPPFQQSEITTPGESHVEEWTLLTAVDQADGAPVDPASLGASGTGFTVGSGLFRHVWASTTTVIDGHQENVLWWSRNLLELYPDFDPDSDLIEVMLDFSASAGGQFAFAASADNIGAFLGLSDHALNTATSGTAIFGVQQSGATAFQMRRIATASATSVGSTGNMDQIYMMAAFSRASAAWRPKSMVEVRNAGSSPATYDVGTGNPTGETMSTTMANWRLVIGSYHTSTVDPAGRDIRWKVYHRRVRRPSGHR